MAKCRLDIIIPAAGMGTRMKIVGAKALIDIDGEPLICRQIRVIRDVYPRAKITVVAGYDAERLRQVLPKSVRVFVNENFAETNVAKSIELGLFQADHDSPVLVIYGDLVFDYRAISQPFPRNDRSWILIDDDLNRVRKNEVGVNVVHDQIVHFAYGLKTKWGHVMYLRPREKHMFIYACQKAFRKKFLSYEILNEVIDNGGILWAYRPEGLKLVELDTTKDIAVAKEVFI